MTADTQERTIISAETCQRMEGPADAMTIPRWLPRSGNSPNDRESRQCPRCGGYNVLGDTMCYDCLDEFADNGVLPRNHIVRYAKGMKDSECPAIDLTPIKAIRAKCLDCVGGGWSDVKYCHVIDCPLYPYRMGKRPVFGARPEEMAADRADNQLAAVLSSNAGRDDSWEAGDNGQLNGREAWQ